MFTIMRLRSYAEAWNLIVISELSEEDIHKRGIPESLINEVMANQQAQMEEFND